MPTDYNLRRPTLGQQMFRPLACPPVVALLIVAVALLLALATCVNASASTVTQGISEHVHVMTDQNGATAVLLPVTIHRQGPFTFELDTGASISLIATGLVRQLGLPPAGSPQTISGIGGVVESTPITMNNWSTGPSHLPTATIASAPMPRERGAGLQGLIGSDIWRQFGKFTLDYSSGTLSVYKQIVLAPDDRRLAPVLPCM